MSDISNYLIPNIRSSMAAAILDASGNEVFFTGYMNKSLQVEQVDVLARGNEEAVPAILSAAVEADVVIHNHPSGNLVPSQADLAVASRLGNSGVAFYIINNAVTEIYVVVEPQKTEEIIPLDTNQLSKLLQLNGQVSQKLRGYEFRPQQIEMIATVTRAFNEDKVAIVEAGTGTGKTLAYLLPAIYWSLQNKERVVISTNTINLQEQLIKKDIPFLQSALTEEFKATLVKGRGNYVCKRKIHEIESELDLFADDSEKDELQHLIDWAKVSRDGSKADLNEIPGSTVWEKIASDSETCTRTRCPFSRQCFIGRARRQAAQAHILVVNHHLLFADLSIRIQSGNAVNSAVLPPYQRVIFDEAHHIEDVATSYFGNQITRTGISRILYRLSHRSKITLKGQLHSIAARLFRHRKQIPDDLYRKTEKILNETLVPEVEYLNSLNNEVMDRLDEIVRSLLHNDGIELKLRITDQVHDRLKHEHELLDRVNDLITSLRSYSNRLFEFIRFLARAEAHAGEDWSSPIVELKAQGDRLTAISNTIEDILYKRDEENVRWIEVKERQQGKNIVRMQISPLEIAQIMNESVYETFNTVIMTSATLATESSFDFLNSRIGLNSLASRRRTEAILSSPFDFKTQAMIGIPTNIPDPRESSFASELGKFILTAVTITKGRTFLLFTSYGLLNLVYNQLSQSLEQLGIVPLKQGVEDRYRLLERFRRNKSAVLFGTDSFWEGVDVVGDALQSVIITKLPFKVPSEPIIEARVEAIEKRGGNSFMQYSVPLAVLKFKQGFGRLIRTKTDYGCVLILDKRVIQKNYGRIFLRSLPECQVIQGTSEMIFEKLTSFLKMR